MGKRNKLTTWIALAMVVVLVVMAGCSGGNGGSNNSDSNTGNTSSNSGNNSSGSDKTAADGGKIAPDGVTFTWFVYDRFEGPVREDWKIFQEIKEKTGVTVDFENVSSEAYKERKQIMIATNELTDFIMISNQEGREHGPENVFLNLKDYLDIAPNLANFYEKYPEAEALATGPDGGLYTAPMLDSYEASKGFDYVWWVRQDLMDEYGLQAPTNMDEFYDFLKSLKEKDPDSYPLTFRTPLLTSETGIYTVMTRAFTGIEGIMQQDPKTNKFEFAPYHENFKDALVYMNKLFTEKLLDPEYALITLDQWKERLNTGKSSVTYFWKADMVGVNKTGQEASGPSFNIGAIPPFAVNDEYNYQFSRSAVGTNGLAISANVKDKEKAVKFLDYLVSEEGRNYLSLGIEGETYTFEDGKPYYNKDFGPAPYNVLRPEYGVWYTNISLDNAIARDAWENAMDEGFAAMQEMYKPHIIPAPRGFVKTEEEIELEKDKLSNLNQYLEEAITKFVMGNTPINDATYDEFIKQAQRLGVDDIVEMNNTAYKRTYGN